MIQGQVLKVLQVLQREQTPTTNSIHVREDYPHSSSSHVQASGFHPANLEMRAEKKIFSVCAPPPPPPPPPPHSLGAGLPLRSHPVSDRFLMSWHIARARRSPAHEVALVLGSKVEMGHDECGADDENIVCVREHDARDGQLQRSRALFRPGSCAHVLETVTHPDVYIYIYIYIYIYCIRCRQF